MSTLVLFFISMVTLNKFSQLPFDFISVLCISTTMAISIMFLSLMLKKNRIARAEIKEILQRKVEISEQVLDVMYDKISLLVDIERKYDLTVEELDKVRKHSHIIMLLMREHNGIEFLNPQNK